MVLLWLVPPVVVTVVAMLWVSWLGREGRGEVSREESLRRMAGALDGDRPRWRRVLRPRSTPGYAVTPVVRDRSNGVAVRRSRPPETPVVDEPQRRAS